jgi:hypothetical protein
MKTTYFSETSIDFQRTTRRYIREDRILHVAIIPSCRKHVTIPIL